MRFLYGYKTTNNERRDGTICAASRESVYKELKKLGIRPYYVELAPGIWNRFLSIGKRGFAIVALLLVVLALVVAMFFQEGQVTEVAFENSTRRQVIGDSAIIEKGIATGWSDVFDLEGERFLASFAVPGFPAARRNARIEEIEAALAHKIVLSDQDGIEARQIKSIVEGIKSEMREFIKAGGSISQYGNLLAERQDAEIRYYTVARDEIANAVQSGEPQEVVISIWEKRNSDLRRMGIRLVQLPDMSSSSSSQSSP